MSPFKTLSLIFLGISLLASGCASMHSHSGGNMQFSGERIRAEGSVTTFFNLFWTDADGTAGAEVAKKLHANCRNGKVTDVESTLSKRDFVLFQVYTVTATATCTK